MIIHQLLNMKKKYVQLETEFRQKPTEIREKEVIYQQPIEVERTNIENVKSIIREDVLLEKEHIYQKLAPKIQSQNVQHIRQNDEFYSKDAPNNQI